MPQVVHLQDVLQNLLAKQTCFQMALWHGLGFNSSMLKRLSSDLVETMQVCPMAGRDGVLTRITGVAMLMHSGLLSSSNAIVLAQHANVYLLSISVSSSKSLPCPR